MCIGQLMQRLQGSGAAAVQAIQIWGAGKFHVTGMHHLGLAIAQLQRAQLAVAAQLLVVQWLLLFDELGLQQQSTNLSRCANVADVSGLPQHAGLLRVAQVR